MSNEPSSAWSEQQQRLWAERRRRGLLAHILLRSILRYGLPIFAANYVLRRTGHMVMDRPWWIWTVSVLVVLCILGGLAEWRWNEKHFRSAARQQQSAQNGAGATPVPHSDHPSYPL